MLGWRRKLYAGLAVAFAILVSFQPLASADYLTRWSGSVPVLGVHVENYPVPVAAQSCVASGTEVVCIGGLNGTAHTTNTTYAAQVSGLGVGNWSRLPDYPTGIAGEACVTYSGYVYCVGGLQKEGSANSTSVVTSAVYFAPLNGTEAGTWTKAADYPFKVFNESCAVSDGYVYCVGGIGPDDTAVSEVEYARLLPSGIAGWMLADYYPERIAAESCSTYSGRLFCVGGLNASSFAVNSVYSSALNGPAMNWVEASDYPTSVAGQSCVVHYPGLYCVGGLNSTAYATRAVYFSYINGTRLDWTASVFYPVSVQGQSCASLSNQIYCVGGYNGCGFLRSVYFSSVGSTPPASPQTASTFQSSSSTSTTALQEGGLSGSPLPDVVLIFSAGAFSIVLALWATDRRKELRRPTA